MLGGMDPKTMARMMKQMGIKTEELDATEVRIVLDGKEIVISNPSVTKMTIKGQEMFQIAGGTVSEEEVLNEEDITMVMEKTSCDRDTAISALKEAGGDIAEAILKIESDRT